jgi:DNA-directed RNA polymerase specialized sigma24 family protein
LASIPSQASPVDVLEIADALSELELEHPEHATVVKLRYFVGMTIAECSDALGLATPTIERRWRYARAWLAQRLNENS